MQKTITWLVRESVFFIKITPIFNDPDWRNDPFYLAIDGWAMPYVRLEEIENTALYQAIVTDKPAQVNGQLPNQFGIVNATATPNGDDTYTVVYEVSE